MRPNEPQQMQPDANEQSVYQQVPSEPVESVAPQAQEQPTEFAPVEPISWQATEYIQLHKTPLWYVGFFVIVLVLMGTAIWLQAWTFAILVPVMAVALLMYTHRPPRQVNYAVSEKGLYINDQLHPMGEFKAFGVTDDHDMHILALIPVKRFRPALSVYFPTEVGEAVVDLLGSYLPMQEVTPDAFDRIIRKLRI